MLRRTLYSRKVSKWAQVYTALFLAYFVATLLPTQVNAKGVLHLWPMAEDVRFMRQQDSVSLSLQLIPHQIAIPSGQALIIEPWLCSATGQDSIVLSTICFYGRSIYYHVVRGGFNPLQDENVNDFFIRARELPYSIPYAAQTPWQSWMQQGVNVHLHYVLVDGCNWILAELTQERQFASDQAREAR